MYQPKQVVQSATEVKGILGPDFHSQVGKIIDHIDDHIRAWIERTPFITIASANPAGQIDVSPKGDPPGFVKVLDQKTLAIPDRIGNHRGDTFLNVTLAKHNRPIACCTESLPALHFFERLLF